MSDPLHSDPQPRAQGLLLLLGVRDFYFISKLFLYFRGLMGFHFVANLAFFVCLLTPMPKPRWERARDVIAVPVGVILFYYDTWFPPFGRLISQAANIEAFDGNYLVELLGRLVSPWIVLALCGLYGVYFFARIRLRVATFIVLAMLATLLPFTGRSSANNVSDLLSLSQHSNPAFSRLESESHRMPTDAELSGVLDTFYQYESGRHVTFSAPAPSDPPFDILVLQVCSLSWDDLDFVKERSNPFFDRFDIVFSNFNSAASYSGPAVIRLLRGSAGHQKHHDLYDPPKLSAQTFENLRQIGYEPQLAMNHDGSYGNLLTDIRERGGLKTALFSNRAATPYLQSFDGTPIYDDFLVLSRWWAQRLKTSSERVALFYNTVSLHDGNSYVNGPTGRSLETYPARLRKLLADVDKFLTQIEASGRRAVVVFIPEHGASIRGDKMQIAGMREIPTPSIGFVPVAVKLVGLGHGLEGKPTRVTEPSSYLAVSQLLAEFIRRNPFATRMPDMGDYTRDLPVSGFVSENADLVVMRYGTKFFMHSKDAAWVEYDPSQ